MTGIIFASSTTLNFPSDVYKWMKKNATSRYARKLMSICKYFYNIKIRVTVVKNVKSIFDDDWRYYTLKGEYHIKEVKNLHQNLFLSGELDIKRAQISDLLNKTWSCNFKKIVCEYQEILFNDFKFITFGGNTEEFIISNTKINYKDGTPVPLEMILKCLPKVVKVYISGNIRSSNFPENLTLPKLKELTLWEISVNFDIDKFSNFMIKNQNFKYYLVFGHSLNQDYIQKIQSSFDKIVETWYFKNYPPQIIFPCQTEESKKAMRKLRKQHLSYINENRQRHP